MRSGVDPNIPLVQGLPNGTPQRQTPPEKQRGKNALRQDASVQRRRG